MDRGLHFRKTLAPKGWSSPYWHFHPDCANWPKAHYVVQTERPHEMQICPECRFLALRKNPA